MITAEMLNEVSTKTRLAQYWEGYRKMYGKDPESRRHPDTVHGFLSKEKADELLTSADPDLLIHHGVATISNREVFFISDDGGFGYGVIPKGFIGGSVKLPMRCAPRAGLEDGVIRTMDQLIFVFHREERLLNSIEELVEYVNSR